MLHVAAIQSDIVWQNTKDNFLHFEQHLNKLPQNAQVVLLPEMFNTGFTMEAAKCATSHNGEVVQWLQHQAKMRRIIIAASTIIHQDGQYFNRLVWMQPDGQYYTYDKRHLFSYAQEHLNFSAGNKRVITQVQGINFCLNICYDLRFPVWTRQQKGSYYDVLVFVANWPSSRIEAWRALLRARAIENQCYVVGVNRVGTDGHNIAYNGFSTIVNFDGTIVQEVSDVESILAHTINIDALKEYRQRFAFLADADDYIIH